EAVEAAAVADTAVIFAGLPDLFESEGYDRRHIRMPRSHTVMIEAVTKARKNTVVVLMNGSPVEMPWLSGAAGVLECYLCGQAVGGAVADILFGSVNPGGRLAETFPKRLSDNPSYLNFPGETDRVEYREGIFVGYRYYEKKAMEPLFPFGFGLSYTDYEYTSITADSTDIADGDTLSVKVTVKNTGSVAGAETVQLYVRDVRSSVIRPEKELKGFEKVRLEPGEEKTVEFTLDRRAFAYYDDKAGGWAVEAGEFALLAGGSSVNTPLKATVTVHSPEQKKTYTRNSTLGEILANPVGAAIIGQAASPEMLAHLPEFALELPLRSLHMQNPQLNDEAVEGLLAVLNR
ncbi:MAG: glycoside hydrolase family 3 C-terminal domain-containing protein, partial [Clostridia bacterium]|nr:glycoside hydrolase family 3 C-terminal domain-containing protein [Clostridia bacterium]